MNPIAKAALQVAEQIAKQAIPGFALGDATVRAVVSKEKSVVDSVPDIAFAAIQVVEGIKEADIADEVKFRAGVATLEAGFKLVVESLKHTPAPAVK